MWIIKEREEDTAHFAAGSKNRDQGTAAGVHSPHGVHDPSFNGHLLRVELFNGTPAGAKPSCSRREPG